MESKKKSDVISGLCILVFCGLGFYFGRNLQGSAAAIPFVTLSGLGILSVLLIVSAFRRSESEEAPAMGHSGEASEELQRKDLAAEETAVQGSQGLPRILREHNLGAPALIFLTILYIFAMQPLGFTLSTPVYLFAMMLILGMRGYGKMLSIALLTTIISFILFRTVMYVSLPGGIFDPTEYIYMFF